jgi:hypothetical protein
MPKSESQLPKVFISHAGQDKERFVLEFAPVSAAKALRLGWTNGK